MVDLPGYGYAKTAKNMKREWSDLIGGYLADPERQLELVFQLIDMRHAPTADDLQMIDFLVENEMPFVIVFTKADKLKPTERKKRMTAFAEEIPYFEDITHVEFSAVTGEGVEEIRGIIEEIASEEASESDFDDELEADSENSDGFSGFLTPRGSKGKK